MKVGDKVKFKKWGDGKLTYLSTMDYYIDKVGVITNTDIWGNKEVVEIIYDDNITWHIEKKYVYLIKKPKKDPIVKRVLKLFKERSKKGIETYGTTLQENNLSTLEWIQEAQSEAMDFCLYLEKLKDKIKEYEDKTN